MILVFRAWQEFVRLPPFGPRARAASLAVGAVLMWATWPTLAIWARPAPPFLVLSLASIVGFSVSVARAAASGHIGAFVRTSPRTILLVTVGLLVNNVLYLMAMPRIGPAEANVIAYLWPILLVLILSAAHRSPLMVGQWGGILAAFLGAALAIGPTFSHGFDLLGLALAFLSGLSFAIYAALRSLGKEPHDVIGPSMGIIGAICMVLHAIFEQPVSLTGAQCLAIAAIGVAPLTLSNALWDRASRSGHAATISGIAYLTPLVSLLLLAAFGVASISWMTIVGALLIVTGAYTASRTN
ncbi:DMT family transporter [Mesorhizobium sp. ES1-1]|uniref:DMT family transporter n=1 Tax=Mesorhizobium sp. ES1-1 TaxID=2876629 RepID=UPI001CCDB2AD|nr:DMT family transporter [Mesorhizobium sp. ES1-1]MBZ9677252.1 DMT family transporter [Mesorhizobium sp. ES1-1]